jgi:hypothetical protein
MSAPVVSLQTQPQKVSGECVKLLRDYLDKAEAGELVGVAIAGILKDRSSLTASSGSDHFQGLLGAIEIMKARMLVTHLEGL